MQGLFSSWIQGCPTLNKNAGDTKKSLQQFTPSSDRPGRLDTDTSQEFTRACEDCSWDHHDTALPYRSATNRTAEGACRRVKEGTASVLMQSGLSDGWWVGAVKCDCYLRDRETPYQTRFCATLNGPVVPSGADTSHTSISQKDEQRLHWQHNVIRHICGIRFACWRWTVRGLAHRGLGRLGEEPRFRSRRSKDQVPRSTSHHSSWQGHLSM